MNIIYRQGQEYDYQNIAALHALSWQQNYRGTLSDDYLDNQAEQDRLGVWQKRMLSPQEGQLVNVCYDDDLLVGFVCTFLDYNTRGAYLDNLHVRDGYQGQQIGAELMKITAKRLVELRPDSALYLWVLDKNTRAKKFYERIGGIAQDFRHIDFPSGGGSSDAYLIQWDSPSEILIF